MKFPKPGYFNKGSKFKNHVIRNPLTGKKAYDSKLERDYHGDLLLRERAGLVSDVEQWPSVELLPDIRYKPDFKYTNNKNGLTYFVDCKGVLGERYRIIKKLWRLVGPATLLEVHRGARGEWVEKEIKSKGYELCHSS